MRWPGRHNLENVLAACTAACLAGATLQGTMAAVAAFTGVEHRLELVRELDGVRYVNDSIATAPDRTRAALETIPQPIILIAGGYDKKIPFDDLGRWIAASRVRLVLLMGKTAGQIEAAVRAAGGPPCRHVRDMAEAVAVARREAQPGDVVLLSPACASYDMYRNYEERGRHFKELVRAL